MQDGLAEIVCARNVCVRNGNLSEFQNQRLSDLVLETSMRAERLAEKVRNLVFGTAFPRTYQNWYSHCLAEIHGIQVVYESEILRAEIPGILPHRKSRGSDYLYKPLYLVLREWCEKRICRGETIPNFREAAICFVHIYEEGKAGSWIRDHDNLEEKQVVDALGMFFLMSDGGGFLDTYHTSIMGAGNRTLLFLMDREHFPEWIQRKKREEEISKNRWSETAENPIG